MEMPQWFVVFHSVQQVAIMGGRPGCYVGKMVHLANKCSVYVVILAKFVLY